ncbi:hypothetical protein CYMTET_4012 [Cymbomonas tetramitiformis]|uniref:Uncharacterized protein n=1 Tax=Cymbomonas tetramitiformis TaxID=36881 RepID=A0AAE0H250_9CHLO|nr:hypothetical protein CYMTET_4012 [Cymbomonas tetramitiformis]
MIGLKLLHTCMTKYDMSQTSPPQDNSTRTAWKGSYLMAEWYRASQLYDVEHPKKASNAVNNPDGSRYGDRQLRVWEWDIVKEWTWILSVTAQAIDLLQATKGITAGMVMPIIGGVVHKLNPDVLLKYQGEYHKVTDDNVQDARLVLLEAVRRRFFTEMHDGKTEDWSVATFLDPRYKQLSFKQLTSWKSGTLTKDVVIGWARKACEPDWVPKEDTSVVVSAHVAPHDPPIATL